MSVALAQVCVDNRLNHELLRIQIHHKLAELYLQADAIFIMNEVGGNLGENFRGVVDMMLARKNPIVLACVLHHTDCIAHQMGRRWPMETTIERMSAYLAERGVACPLVTGNILTENNHILWEQVLRVDANR